MRMARLIVYANAALAAVENDFLDSLDRPIEEVNLLACDREPTAANDPRTPAADLGHLCSRRRVHETLRDFEQTRDVQPFALAEIKADVVVRGRVRLASRPRAAEHDGEDAGNCQESG
jgi:hypothetical protein